MESHSSDAEAENVRTHSSVSRWSPTKEQIDMLENLYKQGIRTPSTEQIQQITSRLRAYGHIEGKNVFYWFQNHKARQRQKLKQKQQSIAYCNCFLHASHPICQNGRFTHSYLLLRFYVLLYVLFYCLFDMHASSLWLMIKRLFHMIISGIQQLRLI